MYTVRFYDIAGIEHIFLCTGNHVALTLYNQMESITSFM
jgi:hypothetical protein